MADNTASIVTFLRDLADDIENGTEDMDRVAVLLMHTTGLTGVLGKHVSSTGEVVGMLHYALAAGVAGSPTLMSYYANGAVYDALPVGWPS